MSFLSALRERGRTLAAVAAIIGTAAAAGCSTGGESDTAQDSGAEGFPVTVEHAMGETSIESAPESVVVLDNSYLDNAIALEMDVIGRTAYSDGGGLRDYLGDEGEKYAGGAEVVGSLQAPDLARIAELQPDLILSAKVRHEDVYDQLSEIAPTVFSETTGATWKENLLLTAESVGKEELAQEKLDAYEKRAADLGDAIVQDNGGTAPTMSLARFAGEPTVRMYSGASFPGIVQADIGLPRPEGAPDAEDQIMVNLSQEEILDLEADHIFVAVWDDGTGDSQEKADEFISNPLWDELQGEKHNVDDGEWVSSVSLQGATTILGDMEEIFEVQAG